MSTAEEIVVKLTATTDQLKAGMAEGAAVVKSTQDEMAASMATSMNAFKQFDDITKQSVKSTEGLASAQAALNAVRNSGAFTSEELAAKQLLVSEAMQKVGTDTQAASGILSAFTRNSRTMYSTSALITDAMTGQYSRMRREVAALSNETGLMARAFGFLVSPAGIAALAVAGLGVAFVEAADRFGKFQQTILSTGDIIGMTAGELQTMSDDVGMVTGSAFDAVDAINKIGRSGLFTGEQLRTAAESAVFFAQVTGENMNKAASVIEQLQDKPKTAIVKLNDQYHFLTQSQAELIVQLLNTGQNAQAAAVAVQAFHDAMSDRAQEMNANTTALARDWHDVKQWTEGSAEALAEYLNLMGGSKDTTDQLNRAYIQLANDQSSLFKVAHPFTNQADAINKDMQAIDALRNKQAEEEAQAKKTAQANKDAATTLDTGVGGGKKGGAGSEVSADNAMERLLAVLGESKRQILADWQSIEKAAVDGSDAQTNALEHINTLQKQIAEEGAQAARKEAEEAKQSEQKRMQLVRKTTADFKQEMQKQAEAAAAAARQQIEDAKQAANASVQAATDMYARIADSLHSKMQLHQITAQQEIAAEELAAEQEYQAELAAYQKEKALVQGQPAEVARVQAQIERLTAQHKLRMQKLDEQAALAFQKTWEDRLKPVSNTFDQMINGMMQGTQTLQQAMRNMLQNIAASFIKTSIDNTMQWIADEMAQTRATQAEAAQRVVITQSAAQQTGAIEAATGQKQIMSAAATAAAKAYQAVVGIPYVGPILAPIAAGVAFAAVQEFTGSLASAAGGWERVPADGMLTQLHKDEMVLPAHVAEPMRQMARNGGGSGVTHHHYNVQSWDSRDLGRFVRRHGASLNSAMSGLRRNGYR